MKRLIEQATGRQKADLVLKNGYCINVFNQQIIKADVAVCGGKIAGIGSYSGEREIDVTGKYVAPGLIDGHVHIESSQLCSEEFAGLVVPRGTTTVIADPHEIANVCGISGAEYIKKAAEGVPLDVELMLPSCVPATPFDSSGAVLTGEDTVRYLKEDCFHGLGEMMNYVGVVGGDGEVIKKLAAAQTEKKIVDGHAPGLSGKELCGYLSAGVSTDHECTCAEEIEEKIALGAYCHLRHGSSTRNLVENARAVNANNLRRFLLCTDDRHAADLSEKGHLDDALRLLVANGTDAVRAVIMATLNVAECYRLYGKGAVAPGYVADLVVFDDLKSFNAAYVIKDGKVVAQGGKPLFDAHCGYLPDCVKNTVNMNAVTADDFKIALHGKRVRCMQIIPDNILTKCVEEVVESENGDVVLKNTDVLKVAVVERHKRTGNIGLGLLKGYGFKGGAMGITVAHDSHNLILLGDDNEAMAQAANQIAKIGGGMVVCHGGKCYSVPLDIGGIMSSKPAKQFEEEAQKLIETCYKLGVRREYDAFLSLAFLSLAVIPDLKITDKGLFDVNKFAFVNLEIE